MVDLHLPGGDRVAQTYRLSDMSPPDGTIPQPEVAVTKVGLEGSESSEDSVMSNGKPRGSTSNTLAIASIVILFFVNLLNYMDRYTIAGVLIDVQEYYNIENTEAGLLQTVFIVSYMLLAPIFGYLGDRYNRKQLMLVGIFIWSGTTLAGSFVPRNHFWAFLVLRGAVGIGEASYSTIAPTIIADLFTGDMRAKMLALFYFAIPVGSGMGYIVGANVAKAFGSWEWSLRVTPVLGIICCFLILFVLREPPRGESEGGGHYLENTSYMTDLKQLSRNKSFMWSTAAFTCVTFATGALALWAPTFMNYACRILKVNWDSATISLVFGVITCLAGFIGVALGSGVASRLKQKGYKRADPLVCGFGLIMSAPFLYVGLVMSKTSHMVTWILIFVGEVFLCLNWAIVADILLYVVIPTRRSTAEAFQILISHAFGDAGSPYIIGEISDAIANERDNPRSTYSQYYALQYALFITAFVTLLGGFCFLMTSLYVVRDKHKADKIIKGVLTEENGNAAPQKQRLAITPSLNDIQVYNDAIPANKSQAKLIVA